MKPNSNHTSELTLKIDKLRKKMIYTGKQKGLCHPETIRYSEELDKLIFKLQKTENSFCIQL